MRFSCPSLVRVLLAVVSLSGLAATSALAVTLTEGPKAEAAETSATITWKTDVACGTKVQYGTSATNLDVKYSGDVNATHVASLAGLQPATTYYYSVGSAKVTLGTGSFTTTSRGAAAHPSLLKKAVSMITGDKPAAPVTSSAKAVATTAPPTRLTWGSLDSLPDHFHRHGGDFHAATEDDYAAQAWLFLQRARHDSLPMKWDEADSTLRVWDPANHIFAAYSGHGRTRTFFKPGNPDYWQKQPGRPIRPAELPF